MSTAPLVKICGLTSEEAVVAVSEAGVDRAGFVFASSVRQVTPARAAELSAGLASHIECVAVLKMASQDAVDRIFSVFPAQWLQADARSLHGLRLPAGVRLLPVVRDGQLDQFAGRLPDPMLYEASESGVGMQADWRAARSLAAEHGVMLAGGLTVDNVGDAIRSVVPYGVDVSSGVERAPGVKDPALIHRFCEAVRRASARGGAVPAD